MKRKGAKNSLPGGDTNEFWICVSDLMANLIFIFMIILTVFSLQFRKEQETLLQAKNELQSPALTRQQFLIDLQAHLGELGVKVDIFPEEGILRLSESALKFPSGKAFPEIETLPTIGHLARALTSFLPCFSTTKFSNLFQDNAPSWCGSITAQSEYQCPEDQTARIDTIMIEGHTDAFAIRIGSPYKDNLSLSAARASTVLRLLALCDPKILELYNNQNRPLIGVSGYSYLRPIIKDNPNDERNRRIDVRFVMELPEIALNEKQLINHSMPSNSNSAPFTDPAIIKKSIPTVIPIKLPQSPSSKFSTLELRGNDDKP